MEKESLWRREYEVAKSELKNEKARNDELTKLMDSLVYAIDRAGDYGEGTRVGNALNAYNEYQARESERIKAIIGAFGYENKDSIAFE